MSKKLWETAPHLALRAGANFDLAGLDRSSTPGFDGDKDDGKDRMEERAELLNELQERLFAAGKHGAKESVLLVIQGLDTAGKGGIVRHVMGMVDPQGVAMASFGVPTKEELSHHYLWRVRRELPEPGKIGVFDRSHYEDVLVARVDELVEEEVWRKRYDEINRFEKKIVDSGTTIIKVALMCSKEEQAGRILERIERPDKRWKHNPGDLDTRAKWDDYQEAYQDVFRLTSTDYAPWYVVPADKKWYSRVAVTELLTQALIDIDPQWPKPRWHVDVQKRRLFETVDPDIVDELEQAVAEQVADAEDDHGDYLKTKEKVAELATVDDGDRAPTVEESEEDEALSNVRTMAAASTGVGKGAKDQDKDNKSKKSKKDKKSKKSKKDKKSKKKKGKGAKN